MFQIVVEILLVCLVLYAFLAAIFWLRKKPNPWPIEKREEKNVETK